MLAFPRIPEVVDGMALSATTLNSYHRGLRYLLSVGHAPALAARTTNTWSSTTATSAYTIWGMYAPQVGATLYANIWFKGTWYAQIRYYGDDSAYHTVWSGDGGSDWQLDDEIDLSSETELTEGNIYQWIVQIWTTAGNTASAAIWAMNLRKTLTGWAAVPTFTNAASSDADEFNVIRTDLNALQEWFPTYNSMQVSSGPVHYVDTSLWHTWWAGAMRWKAGQGLYCSAEFKAWLGNGDQEFTWGIDLHLPTRDGDDWSKSTAYSRDITNAEIAAGGGQYVRFETTIPAATFAALSEGTYYKISYWVYLGGSGEDGNDVYCQRPICARDPASAPAVSWPTLTDWSHGDADAGATRLNAISTALGELYTGGDEALFPELPMYAGNYGAILHAKPWLVYRISAGASPTVRYGADYLSTYSLPSSIADSFVSFDLGAIRQLLWGSRYLLSGVNWAIEADVAYAET